MARENATITESSDMSALKQDIEQLRSDLASLTKHIKGLGQNAVAQARSAGADRVDELRGELERTVDQLRQQGEASVAKVESVIQERPLLSLLAAFGVGMLMTRLLERR